MVSSLFRASPTNEPLYSAYHKCGNRVKIQMDTMGKRQARQEISMVKTVVANMFQTVCDHAIQLFGARGTTNEEPLAKLWAYARVMRIVDGPDEVHNMVVARRELGKYAQLAETAPKPR